MDYNFLTENLRTREELLEYIESIIEEKQEKSDITTDSEYLDEDLNFLNKGVFWLIKDKYNNERLIIYKYSFNSLEAIFDKHKYSHENVWKDFDKSITQNKSFYYFPRGRYEIRKDKKIIIYCSTFFAEEKYRKMILAKLKFKKGYNGIKSVKFIYDNNLHYRYTFDD